MKNKIVLYHGSEHVIEKPQYGMGKKYNDYGMGFYCTQEEAVAGEWAVDEGRNGYINVYQVEMDGLDILNLNDEKYNILHWLTILIENRTFEIQTPIAAESKRYLQDNYHIEYSNMDIIIGYRADDSYFSFAQDFLDNTISYQQLERAMKLGNLGEQIVVKSKRAFDNLLYQESKLCNTKEWYPKKEARDRIARKEYYDLDKNKWNKNDIYMMQILDEEMKEDDMRLR